MFAVRTHWHVFMLQNEHKEVKVDDILGREEAEKAIKEAMVRAHNPALIPCIRSVVGMSACAGMVVASARQRGLTSWQHLSCTGDRCWHLMARKNVLFGGHALAASSLPAARLTCI